MPLPSRSASSSRRPSGVPDAPPDLWLHLRRIPEDDWDQLRELACPRNVESFDTRDVHQLLTTYSSQLRASVSACLPYLDDEVMPSELLSFHQGLSRAVFTLPEDIINDHELDGTIWPADAFPSTEFPARLTVCLLSLPRFPGRRPASSSARCRFHTPPPAQVQPPLRLRRPLPLRGVPPTESKPYPGSDYPYGPLFPQSSLPDEDILMEDADTKRERLVASLPGGSTPSPAGRAKPRFPGSQAAQALRKRSGGESDSSAMPPPPSASVSASSRRPSAASDTSKNTVAPGTIRVKPEPVQPSVGGKGKKEKGKAKGSQGAPLVVSDSEPPTTGKSTRSKVPGARPSVPLSGILDIPAAATEEDMGGPGSLAHLRVQAKIQDKEDSEPGDEPEDGDMDPPSRARQKKITSFQILRTTGVEFNANRPRTKNEPKRVNKTVFAELLALLPAKERQDLPRSVDGKYFKISYDFIRQVMRISDPMYGPRCNVCQLGGSICHVRGYPAMCDNCSRGHGAKICNLTQPDEINNDVWGSLLAYTDLSSESWKRTTETLGQSYKALESLESARTNLLAEYHFNLLNYLVVILRARRELNAQEFWERFEPKATGETLLRLAMAQQLTADTEVTRAYVWQYYEFEHLHLDIPLFKSAYDFYRTYDDARDELDPSGYYLVPASAEDSLEPRWVPVTANDFETAKKDDGKVPAGIRSSDLRKRLRYEKALESGQAKPRPAPRDSDGTPFPHGTGLRPTGFLQKLWDSYGPALFDLEAEEASDESSSSSDSDLSDHARQEMEEVAAGRPTRKQARRDRQAGDSANANPDTVVSPPAPSQASGSSNVVAVGEVKRPVVRKRPAKPKNQPKSNEMVVDSGGE
ncbi:hypothetical protein DFH06DRAFT_1141605 [Mycena polygramma]|nr:hypothetical protein DFH06DRAFT_1141605 [Mycena polygramma]